MARIPDRDMFTNNVGTAERPDLLQQALQPVFDDEKQQDKYMIAWLQTDENGAGQTVQMIPQTTLFGMNANEEVMFKCQDNTDTSTNIPVSISVANYVETQKQNSWSSQESIAMGQINFVPMEIQQNPISADSLAIGNDLQEQHEQKSPHNENMHGIMAGTDHISLNQMDVRNGYYSPQYKISNEATKQQNNSIQQNSIIMVKTPKVRKNKIVHKRSYCVQKAQKYHVDTGKVTEQQILQKLPRILPLTAQNVIRPAQSILRTDKDVNALQNSKVIPAVINNRIISGPNVFTYAHNVNNPNVLTSCIPTNIVNNTISSTNFATKQVHLSSISNDNSITISNDVWKNMQASSQVLNIAATPVEKKTITPSGLSMPTTNPKPPAIKEIRTIIKKPGQKPTKTNPRFLLKSAQSSSAPVSVLKPEVKIALKNSSNQNSTITSQNGLNSTNVLPSTLTKEPKTISSSRNTIYLVQNGANISTQPLSNTQLKQVRQILEQHSPDTETKDRIVLYRVMSLEDMGIKNLDNATTLPNTSAKQPLNSGENLYVAPEKNRGSKRGRPKKSAIQPSASPAQPAAAVENEHDDERNGKLMKILARTRSGRLSRPPRYMINDYKRLPFDKHLTCAQTDPEDSDGGYSEYITHGDKMEERESPLLNGLDVPKRNISDRFKCSTCNKYYLGRSRMLSHFEKHPDHGSPEQLSPSPEPVQKQNGTQDPLKRKGKKRGPWAYTTPEAKSQRRQKKLEDAIAVCEHEEIIKVVSKVLDARSKYDLIASEMDNNLKSFLNELERFRDQAHEKISTMLTNLNADEEQGEDIISISEQLGLCLGINPGVYRINESLKKEKSSVFNRYNDIGDPSFKIGEVEISEDNQKKNAEQTSNGDSETQCELSVSEFFNEGKTDSTINSVCPEVLSALTLMPKNLKPMSNIESNISNKTSNVLISSSEIQSQISDNPGFQKVDINTLKVSVFEKSNSSNDTFVDLSSSVEMPNGIQPFRNVEDNYEQSTLDHMEQAFRRLEPVDQTFNNAVSSYQKQDTLGNLEEMHVDLDNIETGSHSFAKDFHIPDSMTTSELNPIETQTSPLHTGKVISSKSFDKVLPSMSGDPEEPVSNISNNCDSNALVSHENFFLFSVSGTNGEIDENLSMDSSNVNSVDVSNIDEIVKERFQNMVMSEMF